MWWYSPICYGSMIVRFQTRDSGTDRGSDDGTGQIGGQFEGEQ
jgi:hypothetical protein